MEARKIDKMVRNQLIYDTRSGVWRLPEAESISYSDGRCSEAYLAYVLNSARDLSSASPELESYILDWSTSYNLSSKRSQLLKGFVFDRDAKVLEVGCGCGAITRYLGETFDEVTAVEGNPVRAGLARLRTRDQGHVTIINAPFQKLEFTEQFDLIFCIGVFEYARAFIRSDDPYRDVLAYLHSLLTPNGVLVLAVENQFGLTYFCSNPEDHTGYMFDGIEGYHRCPSKPRTFAYPELRHMLLSQFAQCDFLFPFPDYKMPSCIVSKDMLNRVDAGELIAEFVHGSGPRPIRPLFNADFALLEIARNGLVPVYANSFLVFAAKGDMPVFRDWLGILFSSARRSPEFKTCTRILDKEGNLEIHKHLLSGKPSCTVGNVTLTPTCHPWLPGTSLQYEVACRLMDKSKSLDEVLQPTLPWFEKLRSLATLEDGIYWLDGRYMDAIWSNTLIEGESVQFIDLEWCWHEPVRLSYVLIRSFFDFFRNRRDSKVLSVGTERRSLRRLILDAARLYGFELTRDDFRSYISMELAIEESQSGSWASKLRRSAAIRYRLMSRPSSRLLDDAVARAQWLAGKIRKRLIAARGRCFLADLSGSPPDVSSDKHSP